MLGYAARMIRQALVFAGFLLAQAASAEIYRWVDSEGRTHFSDRRPPENAERLTIPDTRHGAGAALDSGAPPSVAAQLGPYTRFDILVPGAGAVLEQTTPALAITIQLDPPLLEGHRLELILDGHPIAVEGDSMRARAQDTDFGAHRLQARVIDRLDAVVAATPVHEFELRQTLPPGVIP